MTPDRTEHTPDEPENGVLSETGSIDTTGIGILGGATAQVNVELPTESDDDLDDDGVIDGEVPFVIEIPADADLPVIEPVVFEPDAVTTEAEIVGEDDDLEEWTVEGEGSAPAPLTEDIADAEVLPDVEEASDAAVEAVEFAPGLGVTPNLAGLQPYLLDVEIAVQGKVLYRTPELVE